LSTFTRYYVTAMGYAASTGDLKNARRLSDPACDGCARYLDLFRTTYERGGFIRQKWSATQGSTVRHQPRKGLESFVTTELSISPGEYKPSADDPAEKVEGSKSTVTFALRYEGGWTVTQFGVGEFE